MITFIRHWTELLIHVTMVSWPEVYSHKLNDMIFFVAPEVENRKQVDIIHFDFRKAFDVVPHDIMNKKLRYYRIHVSVDPVLLRQ